MSQDSCAYRVSPVLSSLQAQLGPHLLTSSHQLITAAVLASGLLLLLTTATGHSPHWQVEGPGHRHNYVGGQRRNPVHQATQLTPQPLLH